MGVIKNIMMGYHHLLIFVIAPILSVSGHGNLVWPYVWQDAGGSVGLSSYGHMTIGGQILSHLSHFERWRILRRFFCRRRVRFFFHFQRNFDRAFLKGFDLCAMASPPCL